MDHCTMKLMLFPSVQQQDQEVVVGGLLLAAISLVPPAAK